MKKVFQWIGDAIFSTTQGILIGILLIVVVGIGLYLKQTYWNKWRTEIPLVEMISDISTRGMENVLEIGRYTAKNFYSMDKKVFVHGIEIEDKDKEPETKPSSDGPFVVYSTWQADLVRQNLRDRGWSSGKLRGANRALSYIDEYKAIALFEMARTGIPASIKLAQGILESNCGDSKLAVRGKNHFGIKAPKKKSVREKREAGLSHTITDDDFIMRPPAIGFMTLNDDHIWDRFLKFPQVNYEEHSALLTARAKPGRKSNYAWIWTTYPVGSDHDITRMANLHNQTKACNIRASEFYNGRTTVPYYMACAAGLKMAGYATSETYHKKITRLIETYELWRFDIDLINSTTS